MNAGNVYDLRRNLKSPRWAAFVFLLKKKKTTALEQL